MQKATDAVAFLHSCSLERCCSIFSVAILMELSGRFQKGERQFLKEAADFGSNDDKDPSDAKRTAKPGDLSKDEV
jgi:hypothetical protein